MYCMFVRNMIEVSFQELFLESGLYIMVILWSLYAGIFACSETSDDAIERKRFSIRVILPAKFGRRDCLGGIAISKSRLSCFSVA